MEPNLPIKNKYKTAKLILLVLAVSVIGFSVWVWRVNKKNIPSVNQGASQTPKAEYKPQLQGTQTELAKTDSPNGMPADLPIDKNSEVVRVYNDIALGGRSQGTKIYKTSLTYTELEKNYRQYFTDNGWTVDPTFKTKETWGISAHNAQGEINVSLTSLADGYVLVNITFLPSFNNSAK